ncbi:MAG: cytochrome c-type biogenesis CcmF C-terminal domain-containing protein, partial [Persicimonas sp.]
MGVGTVIAWRRATWKNLRRDFLGPLVGTAIAAPALILGYWFLRGQDLGVVPSDLEIFYAVATITGCIFVTATIVQEFYRGVAARMRGHDEDPFTALIALFSKQRRRYGGYIVHFGVVLAFVAFAGNALKLERDVALDRGESVDIGDYTVTFEGLSEDNSKSGIQLILADTRIERGGKAQGMMHPGKARFSDHEMMTSEIDIRSTPLEDLYLAFVSADQSGQTATFKIFVGPMTWWFWVACVFIVLGTFICLWPSRDAMAALGKSPMGFGRSVAAVSLVAVTFSPLVVWHVESNTDWGSALRWQEAASQIDDDEEGSANTDRPSETAALTAGGRR